MANSLLKIMAYQSNFNNPTLLSIMFIFLGGRKKLDSNSVRD